jgi:hypothetical protein
MKPPPDMNQTLEAFKKGIEYALTNNSEFIPELREKFEGYPVELSVTFGPIGCCLQARIIDRPDIKPVYEIVKWQQFYN